MRAVVFANGELDDLEGAREAVRAGDLVIAADGGGRHCLRLGIVPAVVIGDFDSLEEADREALEAGGAKLIRHEPRKDETDLELALLYARRQGVDEVLVLGGLGGRWDQTLGNLLLAAHPDLRGVNIVFQDGGQRIFPIYDEVTLEGKAGDTVSLIPVGGDAVGVTTTGLEYPLNGERLRFGETRGVSNVMLGERATVALEDGLILCVVMDRETLSD